MNDFTTRLTSISSDFLTPFEKLTNQVFSFLPQLLFAIAALIIGGMIIRFLVPVLKKLLKASKVDALLKKIGVSKELKGLGIKIEFSELLVKLVDLILKVSLWLIVIDILGIPQLSEFVADVANYLPKVIVAVLILGVGIVMARFTEDICKGASSAWGIKGKSAEMLGRVAKISIVVFTIMIVLVELKIAEELIQTLFTGIVAALSIAGGIAFGLGGQDKAKEIVNKIG